LLASLLEEAHRLGYLEAPFPLRPTLLARTSGKSNMTLLHIAPAHVTVQVHGPPKLSTTLLQGFTATFTAYAFHPESGALEVPSGVHWEVQRDSEGEIEFISHRDQHVVEVKATKTGVVKLQASIKNTPHKNTLEITVDKSDLLVYAPDGYIYRIPKDLWAHNPEFWDHAHNKDLTNPDHHIPGKVVRYEKDKLPKGVQTLLASEVAAANLLPPVCQDNITCFLLNLNSVILSHTPPNPTTSSNKPKP
jgi:hypothetical protein